MNWLAVGTQYTVALHIFPFNLGLRPESVEKYLKQSLADLNLSYIDLYLIHVPFGFAKSEAGIQYHPNGEVILDPTTDHIAVWKVCTNFLKTICGNFRFQ